MKLLYILMALTLMSCAKYYEPNPWTTVGKLIMEGDKQ